MIFAGNFCPTGWVKTDGTLLTISDNSVLYAVIGTRYGGNGTTTFRLPNTLTMLTKGKGDLTQCIATQGVFPSQN